MNDLITRTVSGTDPISVEGEEAVLPNGDDPSRRSPWYLKLGPVGTPLVFIAVLIGLWELLVNVASTPSFLLPAPTLIVQSIIENIDKVARHTPVTLLEAIGGFAIGSVVGVGIAILIVHSKFLEQVILPLLVIEQTIPKLALAPLFIIWFGYGITPKILIAVLISFFPVVVSTARGLISVEPRLLAVLFTLSASRWQVFTKVRFPNAIPYLFTGLRVAVPLSIIGAVVAEFVQADRGLGYLILLATTEIDTPLVFVCVFLLAVMGLGLFWLILAVEHLLSWQKPSLGVEG